MKKRNEQQNQPQAEERRPVRSTGKGQESASDFALHLAAMFRAELGEEEDQLDPLLNWELPASEEDFRNAEAAPEDESDLFRAVADFLEEETGQKAPARVGSDSARSDRKQHREARSEPEQSRKRREEPEQSRKRREEPEQSRKRREEPEQSRKRREEPEQSRKRREEPERARQTAPGEAPAESAAPASERVVFFEPKQKKTSFFDTLRDPERAAPPAPPAEERPAKSAAESSPAPDGREAAPRGGREADSRAEPHERQSPRRSREAPERRQTRADRNRRQASDGRETRAKRQPEPASRETRAGRQPEPASRETRAGRQPEPASRETRAKRQPEPTARHRDRSDLFREITLPASLFQQVSEPEKEAEPLVLPGFDDTPFRPPQEDPSLEELFAPLGLKAAPPDPDTAAVLTPRVREREASAEPQGYIRDSSSSEIRDQGSEIKDQGSEIRDQGSGIKDQRSESVAAHSVRHDAPLNDHEPTVGGGVPDAPLPDSEIREQGSEIKDQRSESVAAHSVRHDAPLPDAEAPAPDAPLNDTEPTVGGGVLDAPLNDHEPTVGGGVPDAPLNDTDSACRGGSYPQGEPPAPPAAAAAGAFGALLIEMEKSDPSAPLRFAQDDTPGSDSALDAPLNDHEPAAAAPDDRGPEPPAPRRTKKQSWLQKLFSGEKRHREPARRDPPPQAPAAPASKPSSLPEARSGSPRIILVPSDSFDEAEVLASMEREIPGLSALLESSGPKPEPLPEPSVSEPEFPELTLSEAEFPELSPAEPQLPKPAEAEPPEAPFVLAAPISAAPAEETPEAPLTHAGQLPEAAEPLPAPVFTVPEAVFSDLPRQRAEAAPEEPLTHSVEAPAPESEAPAALRIQFEEHAPEPPVREEPPEWISQVYVPEEAAEALPQSPADSPAPTDRSPAEPEEAWSDDRLFAAIDTLLEQPLFGAPPSADQDEEASAEAESVPYSPSPDDITASVDPVFGSASAPQSADRPEASASRRRGRDTLSVPELFALFGLRRDPPDQAPDLGQQEADTAAAPLPDAELPFGNADNLSAPSDAPLPDPEPTVGGGVPDAPLNDHEPTVGGGVPDAPLPDSEIRDQGSEIKDQRSESVAAHSVRHDAPLNDHEPTVGGGVPDAPLPDSEIRDQGSEIKDQRSESVAAHSVRHDAPLPDTEPTVGGGVPDAPLNDAEAPAPALSLSFEDLDPTPEPPVEENPVPELWDPLSLFSEAEEEPPQLTPLSRNTTGTLPSLEELFGPTPEAKPKAEQPAARPRREQPAKAPRREKKPSWLQRLFGAVSGKAAGGRQQTALSDQQTAVSDHQSPVTSHQSPELPFGSADNLSASPDAPLNDHEPTVGGGVPDAPLPDSEIRDQGSEIKDQRSESVAAHSVRHDAPLNDPEPTVGGGVPDAPLNDAEKTDPSAPLRSAQDDSPVSDSVPDAPLFDAGTPAPETAPLRLGMEGFLASLGLREPEDRPAGADEAPEAPPPSENSPPDSESAAEDWDPLALFGGAEDDSKLPTWEEYLRSRREASAPKPEEAPDPEPPVGGGVPDAPLPDSEIRDQGSEIKDQRSESVAAHSVRHDAPLNDHEPTVGGGVPDAPLNDAEALDLIFPPEDGPSVPEPPLTGGASEIDPDPPLEALFGPVPEAAPEPEALTVPMDLAEPEPAAEESIAPKKLRGQRKREREALSLKDFLAAAVPMEEAKPPRPEPRKQRAALRNAGADTISTARENPEGLILTWTESEKAPRTDAPPPAAPRPEPKLPGRNGDPVPSADVRREGPPRKATKPGAPHRKEPTPEPTQPPEEKSPLHPEEAYRVYARPLDEIGSRLVLTGLFTLLSLFFTLYMTQHWSFLPEIFSGGTTVYILLGLLGLMVLVNRKLYFREWRDEYGLRAELLLGLATLFTALDCFPAAQELRPPFPVVIGALLMVALWGRYDRGLALLSTVKVLREEPLSAGVSEVQDITKGSRGLIRTKPDVDSFMSKLETRDLTQRVLRIYTPAAAIAGLLLTLLISIGLRKPPLWTGALIFLGSVPVTGLLAFSRLFCLLARRLSGAQAALCGYHGAEVFGGEHSILIGDDDVFPAGSLTLNGFKVYNGNPDRMIAYAAAAFRSSGSALDPVFEDLLVTHNGRHYTVDNFRFYDSGGIGASIMQDVVLLGSLDFMRRMGVHMDKGARVKQAVYMSLNGELAAVFAVRYTPPENLRRGLAAIAGNRHFKGILVTRTFLGTPGFLKVKFGIPTGAFHYPSTKERIRLSEAEMKKSGAQGAILAKDSFSGFAQAAAGGRLLRSATLGAAILTVLGGLIGLVLMGVLAALHAYETATALNLLLYAAAWLAPTLLLTAWARHF